ncbi:NUDIX hydrolase [Williamsia deligens]|uniref:NUDIX hydrolase n=1 Tax=Williamsia deligens TaxID=321325 RepID=A0ABW3G6F2_9NOCA|nr:NUDIX domain-containing protein [Williamsia deligens]MCP2193465.1 NUDIX domain-containing protein [Williamsia deligens]
MTAAIRPIALALIRRPADGAVLVTGHGMDSDDPRVRPVGGGIEFGESARTALDRELREELGVGVREAELLGVFESIFDVDGVTGHEIVFAFRTTVDDTGLHDRDRFPILDAPHEIAWWWRPGIDDGRLVPEALTDLDVSLGRTDQV